MLIRLSDTSPQPLREQIVGRIRELVLRGELPEHTRLPSIRRLAGDLRVGIVTVQRAYEDLEKESVIYARQGRGYFVAPIDGDERRGQAEERVRATLEMPLREALRMGLSSSQIETIVRSIIETKDGA